MVLDCDGDLIFVAVLLIVIIIVALKKRKKTQDGYDYDEEYEDDLEDDDYEYEERISPAAPCKRNGGSQGSAGADNAVFRQQASVGKNLRPKVR